MKIVITGGHHTPALAVIRELRKRGARDIHWIGHKYSLWRDKEPCAEYKTITAVGIPFYELRAGKVYKTFNPLKLIRVPLGFLQAFLYLRRIKPDLIVSFGGYLAVPVVIVGWLLRIPIVTHEQTIVVGLANRVIAKFARKIFITWPESGRYFGEERVVLTGNPLRPEIFKIDSKFRRQIPQNRKTIYITGGKQGAHVINEAVLAALPKLLKKYTIIHQSGRASLFRDYERLQEFREGLSEDLKKHHILKDYVGEDEIGTIFDVADLVISRAGANIIYELAALGKPAILIPIPWVSHDEQNKNAQLLVRAGSAVVLPEKDLSAETLASKVEEIFKDFSKYQKAAKKSRSLIIPDAAEKIVNVILNSFQDLSVPDRKDSETSSE